MGEEISDSQRPYYGMGTCKRMDRPFHLKVIFLDDDESSWDAASMAAYEALVQKGLSFLNDHAAAWGVPYQCSTSSVCSDEQYQLHYEGTVVNDLYSSDVSRDILFQIADDMDCVTEEELYRKVEGPEEQTAIIVAVNKPGISYTIQDEYCDGWEDVEYSVIFNGYLGTDLEATAATTAHEMLHQFGAEDYYDPYGYYPRRKELAEQYYSDDIMLRVYQDIVWNDIGDVTAFTIGWLQEPPEMILNPEWWE